MTIFIPATAAIVKCWHQFMLYLRRVQLVLTLLLIATLLMGTNTLRRHHKAKQNYFALQAKLDAMTKLAITSTNKINTTTASAPLLDTPNASFLTTLSQNLSKLNLPSAKLSPLTSNNCLAAEITFSGLAAQLISCFNALHQLVPNYEWSYLSYKLNQAALPDVTLRLNIAPLSSSVLTLAPIAKHLSFVPLKTLTLDDLTPAGFLTDALGTLNLLALGPYGKLYKISPGSNLKNETVLKITKQSITTNQKTYDF